MRFNATTNDIDNATILSRYIANIIFCITIGANQINRTIFPSPNTFNGVNVGVFDGYLCTISCKRCRFYIYAICFNDGIFTNCAKLSISILFAIFIVITCSYTATFKDNLRAFFCFKITREINVSCCQSRFARY